MFITKSDVAGIVKEQLKPVFSKISDLEKKINQVNPELLLGAISDLKSELDDAIKLGVDSFEVVTNTQTNDIEIKIGGEILKGKVVGVKELESVVVNPNCKKAAQKYLDENPDVKASGVTIDNVFEKHYLPFGSKEGRTWDSKLCK